MPLSLQIIRFVSSATLVVLATITVGCAAPHNYHSARIIADDDIYALPSYLRRRGIPLSTLDDGTIRIVNTVAARHALLAHLNMSSTRMDVIANNIANADATRCSDGGVYRRQRVELDDSGSIAAIRNIPHSGNRKFLRYEPSHPDADEEGYVSYPEVDIVTEMIDAIDASRQYEISAQLLRRFDPELILPIGSEVTTASRSNVTMPSLYNGRANEP